MNPINFQVTYETRSGKTKTVSVLANNIDHAMQKAEQVAPDLFIFLNVESK